MDALLIKIFATALTLSQVTTAPDAVKTHFDRDADQPKVASLLQAGCAHMRKAFDIEDVNIDDLLATAMDDPEAIAGSNAAVFRGINFNDLVISYKQFCKKEPVQNSPVDLGQVIDFYNSAVADLPDPAKLKDKKLPAFTTVLDGKNQRFAEVYEGDQRRIWVPLSEIPPLVQKAFVAAEDKRFFEHKGIDERALIRAFIGNLAQSGRPQGGSTITQQVVKNLLVGDDLSYERKMREMIVATRLEQTLSKQEILELYLNSTYLGRGSWGVEMASRSYFGKSVKDLNVSEAALLAALTKGPTYFSPDRHAERAAERHNYVLTRMQEDGVITAEQAHQATAMPVLAALDRNRRDTGYHFVDQVTREAKSVANISGLTSDSYVVHSTILPGLQRATETALQEGLARFEIGAGRVHFEGPEANLADAVRRITTANKPSDKPAWQQALESARLPLYDVHWPVAVVLENSPGRKGGIKVGLADGRILPLSGASASILRSLKPYDVIFVHLTESKGKAVRADLRVRPTVQGAVVVLENKTGKVLAMAGGFSYPLSQLNRVTQSQRQPGSALKPVTYLAALQHGLQPNTLVRDDDITLPPIEGNRDQDYWSPKNYDGGSSGVTTLRRALEHSKNLATVHLLEGGIEDDPVRSLDRICELAKEAQLYKDCVRYYPFVLGAQPVRPIDLAAFYAAIATEGMRPAPYTIESIEDKGKTVYVHQPSITQITGADRVSMVQVKSMMQGVLARGTANAIAKLAPYVAGKTGTTDGSNDGWFVGFTNDVTIAVWVGYDNADGKRRTLGDSQTGASVAIPIFEPVVEAVWQQVYPKAVLNPPSPEAQRELVARAIDPGSGDTVRGKGFVEYFRREPNGKAADTQYALVSRGEVDTVADDETPVYRSNSRPRYGYSEDGYPRSQWVAPWGYQQQQQQYGYQQRRVDDQWRYQQQLEQQRRQQQYYYQQQQQQQRWFLPWR